ncbi:DUF2306 domain-containing protein [Streptomyces sp. NPDC021356]|uniref:DUF2306 domain-containing protein n=1 Tax=Streptomyces sp. NPDC021356 TaxID=3154900 RepID=UPI0033E77259
MRRPTSRNWRRGAAITVAVVCVAYAPVAMTGLWPYARPGAPAFGEWLLSRAVSPRYATEALAGRIAPYRHTLLPMILHSVLGGLLMLLGPAQLLTAARRRPRLHRALGVAFAVTVYASMAGAGLYLARTAPADAFSGAAFWIVLATLLVGTVASVTCGILAAVRGFPDLHQRWMMLCYAFLLTAPLLRLEWAGLPRLLPGLSMAEINQVALTHLGSVAVFGALVASRGRDRRRTITGMSGSWAPPPVLAAAHVAGAAALTWIVHLYLGSGAAGRRLLTAYLLPYAVSYAVMAAGARRAGRQGRAWAREEWRLHLTALCLAPVLSAGAAPAFEHTLRLDRATALTAGVSIGCGVLATAATSVVALRLLRARAVRRRTTTVPAAHPGSRAPSPTA